MIPLPAFAPVVSSLCLLHACALVRPLPEGPTPVWVRSHNESEVDVYLMCGSIDAQHLGTIEEKGSDAFEIPHERLICAMGLNFFLVVRDARRGYWVGPFRPHNTDGVQLVIGKYAGHSSAELMSNMR